MWYLQTVVSCLFQLFAFYLQDHGWAISALSKVRSLCWSLDATDLEARSVYERGASQRVRREEVKEKDVEKWTPCITIRSMWRKDRCRKACTVLRCSLANRRRAWTLHRESTPTRPWRTTLHRHRRPQGNERSFRRHKWSHLSLRQKVTRGKVISFFLVFGF